MCTPVFWKNTDELKALWQVDKVFKPEMQQDTRKKLLNGWDKAVGRSMHWAEN